MAFLRPGAGLVPEFPSPDESREFTTEITEEAAVRAPSDAPLPVIPLVGEGEPVAQGAAVGCLRHAHDICLVSPIAGHVGRVSLLPGKRLSEIVVFRDDSLGIEHHDTADAASAAGLRRLMQGAGVWPRLGRRPFGGMPSAGEVPAAIVVMAADTRPFAPDPREALQGREAGFARGLNALESLSEGPVFVVWQGARPPQIPDTAGDIRHLRCGPRHPQGSAGIRIHGDFPAGLEAPVWDIHAEDVADLGDLLETGSLPMLRTVRVAGAALREGRRLRTHPGADLRQVTRAITRPGPHRLLSGAHLGGRPTRWLGQRDRQITVLPERAPPPRRHWLVAALTETAGARPVIPTAALGQSLGGAMPAIAFLRALGAGDDEAAMDLGLLSLLEEDVALADYTIGAGGALMRQLRAMLDRIAVEYAS